MPTASIIIRSRNDIVFIETTLQAIIAQDLQDFEIINIDSGSTDGTWEIIKKYFPQKTVRIKPEEYVPGKVLNQAVKMCESDIIVFNNSDCIPQNSHWLSNLIRPLENPEIAAVYGNQAPRRDARVLVVKDHERAYGDGSVVAGWRHFFSLATSATRKKIAETFPFDETLQYSEDIEWSLRLKKAGYKLQYIPDAVVEHSHNYNLQELWKRFYNEGFADGRIWGERPSFCKNFILPWCGETCRDIRYLGKHGSFQALPVELFFRFIQKYAAWRGCRDYFNTKLKSGSK